MSLGVFNGSVLLLKRRGVAAFSLKKRRYPICPI
ncbi:hypothetical protein COLO4_23628 [Corchorus olitorius]|uniref:Uncharacterized protein n=1 Tax=Corchorus olitorius TaxID=93759 RepID=A0A1R3IFM5_9ROSI|nr:hypothetical protein COLO4_23628 [Corchorus olitorius]